MPRPLTEQERQAFLAEPHIGVLSVAGENNRPPLMAPIWYGYQPGGQLTFFTGTQTRKAQLLQRVGVLSFLVQREQIPYKYVTVEGAVVKSDQPPSTEQMLAVVRRYLPEEAAQAFVAAEIARSGTGLVHFTIRPDRWLTADFTDDFA